MQLVRAVQWLARLFDRHIVRLGGVEIAGNAARDEQGVLVIGRIVVGHA